MSDAKESVPIPRWFFLIVGLTVPSGVAWCSWVSVKIVAIEVRMEQHSNIRADLLTLRADLDVIRSNQAKQTTEIELLKLKTLDMPRAPRRISPADDGAAALDGIGFGPAATGVGAILLRGGP